MGTTAVTGVDEPLRIARTDAELLARRTIPADQPLDAWPVDPPPGHDAGLAPLVETLTGRLRGEPGYARVDTGLGQATDDELCDAAWNLFTAVCRPVPQYQTGELIFPVEVAPNGGRYSLSNTSGEFHTDGTLLVPTPAVTCLFCLAAADHGGETVVIDGPRLYDDLAAADPGLVDALLSEHPWDTNGQVPGVEIRWQPVVTRDDGGGLAFRYLRSYIDTGYRKLGRPMAGATRAALDAVDRLASEEDRQIAMDLQRGQVLMFANQRFLHGRRPFREGTAKRRLRRGYGLFRS